MGTAAPAVKARLVEIIEGLAVIDGQQVLYGARATVARQTQVAVLGISTDVTRPHLGTDPRSREELHQVKVRATAYRTTRDQQAVTEIAYGLIDDLAEYLRTGTNPAMGLGSHQVDAWISSYEMDEAVDDQDVQERGRYASVEAVVTVAAFRI
jgi:hypothetical protein